MKLMTSDPKTGRCAKLRLTGPQGAAGGEAGEGDAGMEKEEGRERTGPELLSGVASFDFQSGLGQTHLNMQQTLQERIARKRQKELEEALLGLRCTKKKFVFPNALIDETLTVC